MTTKYDVAIQMRPDFDGTCQACGGPLNEEIEGEEWVLIKRDEGLFPQLILCDECAKEMAQEILRLKQEDKVGVMKEGGLWMMLMGMRPSFH